MDRREVQTMNPYKAANKALTFTLPVSLVSPAVFREMSLFMR